MVDFGEELTIESYRIPWLIWIQLLVLILLFFLLYCFSCLASDHLDPAGGSASTSQLVSQDIQIDKPLPEHRTGVVVANCLANTQVGEQVIKGGRSGSTSRRFVREEIAEREGSSSPPAYHHPCHYFRLARVAFLKCLGLDCNNSENSSSPEQRKRREQRQRRES